MCSDALGEVSKVILPEEQFDLEASRYEVLVAHAHRVSCRQPLVETAPVFAELGTDFLAVFDGDELVGLCSYHRISSILTTRFGPALYGSKPTREFLQPTFLAIRNGQPLDWVVEALMTRPRDEFNDAVVLLSEEGAYLGLIPFVTLARLQSRLLADRLVQLERRHSDLAKLTDEVRETNARLATARDAALESARAKSTFLGTLSHEFLTPMNGVLGFLELLEQTSLNEEQKDYVRDARTSANRLHECLSNLVSLTDLESRQVVLRPSLCRLSELLLSLRQENRPKAAAKNLTLICELEVPAGATLVTDERRLRQILVQLLGNAIKFSDSGTIRLGIRPGPSAAEGSRIRFEVSDEGPGIPEAEISRLFEMFHPGDTSTVRRQDGLGVGLAVSQQLLGLLGSRIQVESHPGAGSRFWFDLGPLVVAEAAAPPRIAA